MRGFVKECNPRDVLLENIMTIMSTETFGKVLAARIVGGERKLTELIADGEIEVEKTNNSKNGKWYCNAAQVLAHCRLPRRKKS